jgi:hypothetical protein
LSFSVTEDGPHIAFGASPFPPSCSGSVAQSAFTCRRANRRRARRLAPSRSRSKGSGLDSLAAGLPSIVTVTGLAISDTRTKGPDSDRASSAFVQNISSLVRLTHFGEVLPRRRSGTKQNLETFLGKTTYTGIRTRAPPPCLCRLRGRPHAPARRPLFVNKLQSASTPTATAEFFLSKN